MMSARYRNRRKGFHWFSVLTLFVVFTTVGTTASAIDLIDAARSQGAEAVKSLLAAGEDPNTRQNDGATALHWAVYREDTAMVALLIEAGGDVNAVNRLGASALYIAAKSGNGELIESLLKAGASPNLSLKIGESPLMTASRSGTVVGVRELIKAGAEINIRENSRNQTALMWAAAQGHTEVVRLLVDASADLEASSKVRPRLMFVNESNGGQFDHGVMENLGGYTALLFAARNGNVSVANILLNAGADIDRVAGNGASPVVVAVHSGHTELTVELLEQGADANNMGAGYSALHAAILRGDLAAVEALLDHGADANIRLEKPNPIQRASEDWSFRASMVGATPYWIAASFREPEIMQALVRSGADAHLTNQGINRPLRDRESRVNPPPPEVVRGFASPLQAAISGDSTRQRFYVQANPDPLRESRLTVEAVKVAIDHGVNLNHIDFTGVTALHSAVGGRGGSAVVARELLENGADVNALDGRGQTPLDLAVRAEASASAIRQRVIAAFGEAGLPLEGESISDMLKEFGGVRSAGPQ